LMKGDVVVMLLNLILKLVKVLVAVTVCDGLVVPTLTLPNARLVGLTTSWPLDPPCADAGLGAARPIAKRRKKLRTENVKMDDFDRDMANPPMNSAATKVCTGAHKSPAPIPQDFADIDSRYEIGAAHYTQLLGEGIIRITVRLGM
jgi:hypothetical protein